MNKNIILLYESKRGSTQDAADWIAAELPNPTMINLHDHDVPDDIEDYETIILGTGILAGRAYGGIRDLVKSHRDLLLKRDLCLFITHLEEGEGIELDFQSAYDEELLEHARHRQGVGGRLDIKKVNFMLRPIVHMIAKDKRIDIHNHDTLSRDACKEFAQRVLSGV